MNSDQNFAGLDPAFACLCVKVFLGKRLNATLLPGGYKLAQMFKIEIKCKLMNN